MATTFPQGILDRTSMHGIPSNLPARPEAAFALAQKEARALAGDLRLKLRGEVRFDEGSRALYATDASSYRQVPIGVVLPRDADDVIATLDVCRRYGAPIVPRGGGTSLAGQCCNVAVVLDTSKYMHGVLSLDPSTRRARVLPGTVLDVLRNQAERHHLTFAPDPSTHDHCTLGGMIGNNSCGTHSVYGGKTVDNVEELDVLLYDGTRFRAGRTSDEDFAAIVRAGGRRAEVYRMLRALRDRTADLVRARFPRIPRRVSGYNLDQLLPENGFDVGRALVGTEGTCALVLEATTRLVYSPPCRSLLVLGYDDVYRAAAAVPRVMEHHPLALEGIDDRLVDDMKKKHIHPHDVELLPAGKGWLLVELGGDTKREADDRAREIIDALEKDPHRPLSTKLFDDVREEKQLWKVRESGLGATARVPGAKDTWEGWEDSAVPPERLGHYLRDFRRTLDEFGYGCALYGHFGQGCVHTRIDFDQRTTEGLARYRAFVERMADIVVSYGGSLSGEHGDGQSRAELLPKMFGPELVAAFAEFKAIFDPLGKMNPGKVVRPYRLDENLRMGPDFRPAEVTTHFRFPDDHGDFRYAMQRCVGVGACRRHEGGTMCPSYMVTREEMHSTRGRAHLLFEMLVDGPLRTDGGIWKNERVKEALDLCLSCKGCKGECPINVDMPTYKAEFLAHYYEGRLRPRSAYAFGLIDVWARLASHFPRLANFLTHAPVFSHIAKWLAGIAPQRTIPRFAEHTFKSWWRRRPAQQPLALAPPVILWADTFNDHFHPEVCEAAVEVLEAAGFRVLVPTQSICCGRPLYDYGMLDRARSYLERVLDVLRAPIRAGVPVVGLEPSCLAVFRDELPNLLHGDADAEMLSQRSFLLGEFLHEHARDFLDALHLEGDALLHGHCHHKALVGLDGEQAVLNGLGLSVTTPDTGCCGMAGGFGFEREHYDVSIAAGERVLLPAVRALGPETSIVADGFSCREQIEQQTGRRPLHLAQVLRVALHERAARHRDPSAPLALIQDDRARWARRAPRHIEPDGGSVIDKLNPVATDETGPRWNAENVRWLGYGAVLAVYGAVVAGALLVRARSQRSARPHALDLAMITAGLLGVLAVGDRILRRRREEGAALAEPDEDRFSHPALNVQRISFA